MPDMLRSSAKPIKIRGSNMLIELSMDAKHLQDLARASLPAIVRDDIFELFHYFIEGFRVSFSGMRKTLRPNMIPILCKGLYFTAFSLCVDS